MVHGGVRGLVGGAAALAMAALLWIAIWDAHGLTRQVGVGYALLVSGSLVGIHTRNLAWQVSARAVALGCLVTWGAFLEHRGIREPADLLWVALPASVLLAAGGRGLSTPEAHARFSPIGYRRSFLAAATVQLGGAQFLALLGTLGFSAGWERGHAGILLVAVVVVAMAGVAALGAYAVLRMRAWGVLLSVSASVTAACCGLVVALTPMGDTLIHPARVAAAVFALALVSTPVVLPVIASWIRPVRT